MAVVTFTTLPDYMDELKRAVEALDVVSPVRIDSERIPTGKHLGATERLVLVSGYLSRVRETYGAYLVELRLDCGTEEDGSLAVYREAHDHILKTARRVRHGIYQA